MMAHILEPTLDGLLHSSNQLKSKDAMRRILLFAGVLILCTSATTPAQWLNYKTPGVRRTPDGKPKLDAPAPRTADGRPDLSGVWMHEVTTVAEFKRLFGALIDEAIKVDVPGMEIGTQHKYGLNILLDFTPDNSPMRPDTLAAFMKRLSNPAPETLCDRGGLPAVFPLAGLLSEPIKIVQAPRLTMVLYELGGNHRQIYTDGRQLPADYSLPAYLGYSVGRWERDTFVVETAGFNDQTLLDAMGHAHSDQLRSNAFAAVTSVTWTWR